MALSDSYYMTRRKYRKLGYGGFSPEELQQWGMADSAKPFSSIAAPVKPEPLKPNASAMAPGAGGAGIASMDPSGIAPVVSNMLSGIVDTIDKPNQYGRQSVLGTAYKGGLQGGTIGMITGLISGLRAKKEEDKMKKEFFQRQNQNEQSAMNTRLASDPTLTQGYRDAQYFDKGGKLGDGPNKKTLPPIVVNNPKDPRLKAYSDSMALYQGSNQARVDNLLRQGFKYDTDNKVTKNYIYTNKEKDAYQKEMGVNRNKGLQKIVQSGNDGKTDNQVGGQHDTKAQYELASGRIAPIGEAPLFDNWWRAFKEKPAFSPEGRLLPDRVHNPDYGKPYAKDKSGEVIRNFFNVPLYKKPTQSYVYQKSALNDHAPIFGNLPIPQKPLQRTTGIPLQKVQPTVGGVTGSPKLSSPGNQPSAYRINWPDEKGRMQTRYFNSKQEYDAHVNMANADTPDYRGSNNFDESTEQGGIFSTRYKQQPQFGKGGPILPAVVLPHNVASSTKVNKTRFNSALGRSSTLKEITRKQFNDTPVRDTRSFFSNSRAKERGDALWNGTKKLTAAVQYAPVPIVKYPAMALNSAMGTVDAYSDFKKGDKVNGTINAVSAIPLMAGNTLRGMGTGLTRKMAAKVARSALVLDATDAAGVAADWTDNFGLEEKAKGGAFKTNPAHKGWCTPMTKKTCTGRRRAFAKTMKKHHGFHAAGGPLDGGKTPLTPDLMTNWNNIVRRVRSKNIAPDVLDHDPKIGYSVIDDYNKSFPNAQFPRDRVSDVQSLMQDYRQRSIDKMKAVPKTVQAAAGYPYKQFGEDFAGYMPNLSPVDNFPGSKTLNWEIPSDYLTTHTAGGPSTERLGFAPLTVKGTGGKLEPGDIQFQRWFKYSTREGKAGIRPYDKRLGYDYRSYYDDLKAGKAPYVNPFPPRNEHYPDTYKLPGHPSFSVESMYYRGDIKKQPDTISWDGKFRTGGSLASKYRNTAAVGGQLTPQSSDGATVTGNKHSQGGIQLPEKGAEVEGGETVANDYVYSDQLSPDGQKTFAELHEPIMKAKGKIELKPATRERVKAIQLLEGREQQLAMTQEYLKKKLHIA